ncbi:hypothetical protein P175DRAFT_0464081 [Aspergillus ochraceoroseus IBT 24754]|nr:uncharacterized protein P175DRAFT_0464081 [Aspergillus ochraceoroseus IBT 24754]KKK23130.1 hypothetical protein AOCH_003706 [Aspergillus ochraceoroseus]PTU18916.1 hypothetical protein P175DRAFT_0464081 [Aspergillus ochraceoroseus IBT 24754]
MPPRSTRAAPASAAVPKPAPKRSSSSRASGTAAKRQKYNASPANESVKSTTKKSKYFPDAKPKKVKSSNPSNRPDDFISENDDDPDAASPDPNWDSPEPGPAKDESTDESSANEETEADEIVPKRRNNSSRKNSDFSKSTARSKASISSKKTKELWREGVKTGLGPGKEVFIEKPKARDPGDISYKDETLHPNTLLFLKDLTNNNDREWLKAHDPDFRASKKDWETFVETLTEKVAEKDSTIPELPAKDLVFRIHRDIRFSKDPTPYKTHFSAAWSRTGKKGPYAAYYVHFQPGACFVGSGLWHPEAHKLALLREDIDGSSHRLKAVLREKEMRREILGGIPDDEGKAVKAFCSHNSETALKTKPKGYELDNENIQLLRLRSFTIGKPLSDEELLSSNVQEKIATLIGIMEPFVSHSYPSLCSQFLAFPPPFGRACAYWILAPYQLHGLSLFSLPPSPNFLF